MWSAVVAASFEKVALLGPIDAADADVDPDRTRARSINAIGIADDRDAERNNWRAHLHAPLEPRWRDVLWTVTPVWVVLVVTRVLFYGLERLRYPDIVPPVSADAIQGVLLWPLVVVGCYLTLAMWRRQGFNSAILVALAATLVLGASARPAYALASILDARSVDTQVWLATFFASRPTTPSFWYPWLSNAVEYGVLFLMCVTAAAGILSFRRLLEQRLRLARVEATAARERLRALRTQLNPHFLFNTLNGIVSLSDVESRPAQVLTQLSDLLRRTLLASEQEEHTVSEELAYIEAYLRIEEQRLPSRIDWRTRLDLQRATAAVPSLVLLPLVENAVTHGLRRADVVRIRIRVQSEDSETGRAKLVLIVTNSCTALAESHMHYGSGMGLRHVHERLDVLYGDQASLHVRPQPDQFEVCVRLPLHERRADPRFSRSVHANSDR